MISADNFDFVLRNLEGGLSDLAAVAAETLQRKLTQLPLAHLPVALQNTLAPVAVRLRAEIQHPFSLLNVKVRA